MSRLAIMCAALCTTAPMVARAQSDVPDLSGTWYVVDPNSQVTSCIVEHDSVSRLVDINNGVNPIHIFTQSSMAVEVAIGDGPLATTFFRSSDACVADANARMEQFNEQNSTIQVQPSN